LENSTAKFECPILSDLGAHIEWAKYYRTNDTKALIPDYVSKLEVSIATAFLSVTEKTRIIFTFVSLWLAVFTFVSFFSLVLSFQAISSLPC
jgi:hypothetical protein